MTTRQKQSLLVRLFAQLVLYAETQGYEMAIGYWTRSSEENARVGGHPQSLHLWKLAVDVDLFRNGRYLSSTESHRQLGEFWESLHPLCRWGGKWGDGNHYSIEHGGRK